MKRLNKFNRLKRAQHFILFCLLFCLLLPQKSRAVGKGEHLIGAAGAYQLMIGDPLKQGFSTGLRYEYGITDLVFILGEFQFVRFLINSAFNLYGGAIGVGINPLKDKYHFNPFVSLAFQANLLEIEGNFRFSPHVKLDLGLDYKFTRNFLAGITFGVGLMFLNQFEPGFNFCFGLKLAYVFDVF